VAITVANIDTTPPVVNLTWPTATTGRLSGVVTLAATATDAGGISGVEFRAGDTIVGSDTTAPYAFVWNTVGFPPGVYPIAAHATDTSGNTAVSAAASVLVDQPPVVTVTPIAPVEATSPAGATVTLTGAAVDADAADVLSYQWEDSGTSIGSTASATVTLSPGPHAVVFRATDNHGVSTEDYLQVDIIDTIAPVLTVPENLTVEANARLGALVSFTASASDVVDPNPGVSCTAASGSLFPIGPTIVTCTATDDFNNSSSGQFTVIVVDTIAPVVVPPAAATVAATEADGARANVPTAPASLALKAFLEGASVTDVADGAPLRLAPQAIINGVLTDIADNSVLPPGATAIAFRYRDASGNIGTGSAVLTVAAPIGGIIAVPDQAVVATDAAGVPQPLTVSFTGLNQPGLLTAQPVAAPPPPPAGYELAGTVFDVMSTALATPPLTVCLLGSGYGGLERLVHFESGAWVDVTGTVSATGVCGTVNTLSPFGVIAPGNHEPVADAGAPQVVEAAAPDGSDVTLAGTGTDVDPADPLTFSWHEGVSLLGTEASITIRMGIGAHTLTFTVTDSRGASASATTTVLVQDTTAPTLTLPPNQMVEATSAAGSAVSFIASAFDAVGGNVTVTCSPAAGTVFPLGDTPVTCSALDPSGNTAAGTFMVNVSDRTPPAVSFTAPSAGDVRGLIALAATATDLVGVTRVEFYLDGTTLIGVDTKPSYNAILNTAAILNGSHTLSTSAYDAAGNRGDSTISVTVSNSAPIVVSSLTASVASPAPFGTSITWTAAASGGTGSFEYQFWRYSVNASAWSLVQDYGTSNSFTWTPQSSDVGAYSFQVWVRTAGSGSLYESYAGSPLFIVTTTSSLVVTSNASTPASRVTYGTPVTWAAVASGGSGPLEFEFWRYCLASPGWVLGRAYSANATYTWTPQASDAGMCYSRVLVRHAGTPVPYEALRDSAGVLVTGMDPIDITALTATPAPPVSPGTSTTWTAVATGGRAPLEYQFWRYSYASGSWSMVRDYSGDNSYTWTPAATDVGMYVLHVRARSSGAAAFEAYLESTPFTISSAPPVSIGSFVRSTASSVTFGTPIMWTAVATGGAAPLQYEFSRYCMASPTWLVVRPYGPEASFTWTPEASDAGMCYARVRVRSHGSSLPYEASLDSPGVMIIGSNPIAITSIDAAPAWSVSAGTLMTFTTAASGGVPPLQYQYWRYSYATGVWAMVRDYSEDTTYQWTPAAGETGQHVIHVRVRSLGRSAFEAYKEMPVTVY
jgi:hypothetical protein